MPMMKIIRRLGCLALVISSSALADNIPIGFVFL